MKVLDEIRPSEEERKNVKKIIDEIFRSIKIKDAKLELGGSYAKDTFLKGSHDIDVFVKFPYEKYKSKDISKILDKGIKLRHKKIHGSRDYFQLEKNGYSFEFIPVLDIKDSRQAKNITDVSPLHKKWVTKNLKNYDDARLMKKFCRARNVYGAESYIKGFSGYAVEILIVYYKSFINAVKSISVWRLPVYIDAGSHYKNKEEAFKRINKSKRENNLVIVDPVQKERNAAAAISREKIEMLVESCRNYLHNPSDEFFIERKISIQDLIVESGRDILMIARIRNLNGKKDVVGSKVLKVYSYIEKKLGEYEFKVKKSGWEFNSESMLYYIVKDERLSNMTIHYGPPLEHEDHVSEFRKRYRNARIINGRISAELKRKVKNPKDFCKEMKKDFYIREKIKKIDFTLY